MTVPVIVPLAAGEVSIVGPLTVSQLVGREVGDEGSLSLTRTPAYVMRHHVDGGAARYAVVLGESLGRRGLMDLLYAVAPYKAHGPDRFSRVIDNWHLHDRAKTSSGSESLLLQHSNSLKLSWHEFARHRELFISIFEDVTESTRVVPIMTWEKSPGGMRRWHFEPPDAAVLRSIADLVPILMKDEDGRVPQLNALLGIVAVPYFMPDLAKSWRPWQPLVKNGKSNYIGPASVPVMALMHRRALLNSALIRNAEESIDQRGIQP